MQRLIRIKEVSLMTGRSRSRIYDDIKMGKFPRGVKIGDRAIAWPLEDVQHWIASKIAETVR